MIPYATISQRLRRAAHRHHQSWQGHQAFVVVRQPGVIQVRHWCNDSDMARLRTTLEPVFNAAADHLRRRYGVHGRNMRRTMYLFSLFWRSLQSVPPAFVAPIAPRRWRFHVRWLHEWSLVAAGPGMTSPLLSRVWSLYPRHGIPCGLRQDGTLIVWIGPRDLRFL